MRTVSAKPPAVPVSTFPLRAVTVDKYDGKESERLSESSIEYSLDKPLPETLPTGFPSSEGKAVARVALIGFGNVGRSVAKILCEPKSENSGLELTHIFNRNAARKKQSWVPSHVIWSEDLQSIPQCGADIIVELIGGLHPAEDLVRRALNAGKSVVTANKQLIARHGTELLQLASAKGCQLEFGASVAGGVPVLPALRTGLCGDRLHGIAGILNGTCNYILSRIESDRIPFSEALEEAQARGYAEADASEDLDGGDARAKLAILALAGLQVQVAPSEIRARTIRTIEAVDFDYDLKDNLLFAEVGPSLVPAPSPFGRVQKNLNMVLTSGEYGGDVAFLGAGAGGDPTAVAVVSDLMSVAENLSEGPRTHRPLQIPSPRVSCDFETPWYLRFVVKDQPGIIAGLAAILSAHYLNIDAVLQKPGFEKTALPFVITLEPCSDAQLQPALQKMSEMDFSLRPCLCLPILR